MKGLQSNRLTASTQGMALQTLSTHDSHKIIGQYISQGLLLIYCGEHSASAALPDHPQAG